MQRDSTVVQELLACCSASLLKATLSGAIVAANKPLYSLKRAMLHRPSLPAASMLASCIHLASCCIRGFGALNLTPLQALPNLSQLSLRKGITAIGVGKLAQLTELELNQVISVHCDGPAQFIHGLKRLSANECTVEGLHDLGVAACAGLQDLLLVKCCIPPVSDQFALFINLGVSIHPRHLGLTKHLFDLTQLTQIQISGSVNIDFECSSVFLLTNLVCLDLTFYLEGDHEVRQYILTDQLGVLHSLEHFAFRLFAPQGSTLVLEVSWHMMPLLQTVTVSATRSMFRENILGFAKLTTLQCLKPNLGELADDVTAYFFNFMKYNMSTGRHDTFPLMY